MTLQEFVNKNGSAELSEHLKTLEQQASFGAACREALLGEVVTLGVLLDFGADDQLLRKSFGNLSYQELSELKAAMQQKTAVLFPTKAQLPSVGAQGALEAAYII